MGARSNDPDQENQWESFERHSSGIRFGPDPLITIPASGF
jgi:hypothetical protein